MGGGGDCEGNEEPNRRSHDPGKTGEGGGQRAFLRSEPPERI